MVLLGGVIFCSILVKEVYLSIEVGRQITLNKRNDGIILNLAR